ncbi:1-acyl-sn-glycerol-3-phosphate acyltransferase [Marinobacter sp. BSs20148]|jgi:glycerol-3-phosphate O-acyltransferase|uniref:1-acyl-sn-glycerol-3-phosphate acyltransferase n=1 Tax=Marinobacter sp. BSs20148 TaxID=490759 RepID=UPI0002776B18|nr:1-acyl-sn-glycerol-3-phosphate acyltransferase [Marinobacter sp. BSs20148]AFP30936.1 hypothetical protein MRBBS_1999 [Marinobacter sp. BSs20148]
MQKFDAIRPYSDEETSAVIQRLVHDREFLNLIGRIKSPGVARWAPAMLRGIVSYWLRRRFGGFTRIDDLQASLSGYVGELVGNTTTRVTQSGLQNLEQESTHLFICNHRDIVFDPMIVNFLLYNQGLKTTRIAIGDNLLENRVFAEMMRLNKSFVVRRSMTSPREIRDAYLMLSEFITHSIETHNGVWIAQREGRAKDGIDRTDPAIVKMFHMSPKKSGLDFQTAINRLSIVPVSIAYEFDPCDLDKANELEIRARTGAYLKAEGEDTSQIMRGLTGFKGHVHVHFGAPIEDAEDNPKALAARIDREVHSHYHLHPSNLVAYQLREAAAGRGPIEAGLFASLAAAESCTRQALGVAENELQKRLDACEAAARPYLLDMYANPVTSALNAMSTADVST